MPWWRARRGFANGRLPIVADDVSRVVEKHDALATILANASEGPFERIAPALSRAMIDAAVDVWRRGASPAEAVASAAAVLARRAVVGEQPIGWMIFASFAETIEIASIGDHEAWLVNGGTIVARTAAHSLRARVGIGAPNVATRSMGLDELVQADVVRWQQPAERVIVMTPTVAARAALHDSEQEFVDGASTPAVAIVVDASRVHAQIDELLRDYFAGTCTRGEVLDRIAGLMVQHGADAVIDALPPPWAHNFARHANTYTAEVIAIGGHEAEGRAAIPIVRAWLATHPGELPWPAPREAISDFFMLTHDAIDFGSLDTQTLFELAVQREEPFIATSALHELATRHVYQTRDAAEAILLRGAWDRWLTASAFEILVDHDRRRADELIDHLLAQTDDHTVLDAMMHAMLSNRDHYVTRRDLTRHLASRVSALDADGFPNPATRARFLEVFDG